MIPKPEQRDRIPNPFKDYKAPKQPKRLKQVGKRGLAYNHWRDTVAKPYLDKTYGHVCSRCGCGDRLDVAHISGRGRNAVLKMVLTNVKWLCRTCHMVEDSGFRYNNHNK